MVLKGFILVDMTGGHMMDMLVTTGLTPKVCPGASPEALAEAWLEVRCREALIRRPHDLSTGPI